MALENKQWLSEASTSDPTISERSVLGLPQQKGQGDFPVMSNFLPWCPGNSWVWEQRFLEGCASSSPLFLQAVRLSDVIHSWRRLHSIWDGIRAPWTPPLQSSRGAGQQLEYQEGFSGMRRTQPGRKHTPPPPWGPLQQTIFRQEGQVLSSQLPA